MKRTQDIHVRGTFPLIAPRQLREELPLSDGASETVFRTRQAICDILERRDPRLLVVVGPCSIHDEQVAMDYAGRLAALAQGLQDQLLIVMRVYFEKPRTTIGWKGLINDPHLDGTFDIALGLKLARKILLAVNELGLPVATEMLDPITPQYTADLVSWASLGARTTESQTHRQMASGLSMPVGYKNGTDGNLEVAIQAMVAVRSPHDFLGIDQEGRTCVVRTTGNRWKHLILRGGRTGPNYDSDSIKAAVNALEAAGVPPRLMVDCSHANSMKNHKRQRFVWDDVIAQRVNGNTNLVGLMLESNLHEGSQPMPEKEQELQYGVSITDACIGWDETESLLRSAHAELREATATARRPA